VVAVLLDIAGVLVFAVLAVLAALVVVVAFVVCCDQPHQWKFVVGIGYIAQRKFLTSIARQHLWWLVVAGSVVQQVVCNVKRSFPLAKAGGQNGRTVFLAFYEEQRRGRRARKTEKRHVRERDKRKCVLACLGAGVDLPAVNKYRIMMWERWSNNICKHFNDRDVAEVEEEEVEEEEVGGEWAVV
jgi:hypothetical protein